MTAAQEAATGAACAETALATIERAGATVVEATVISKREVTSQAEADSKVAAAEAQTKLAKIELLKAERAASEATRALKMAQKVRAGTKNSICGECGARGSGSGKRAVALQAVASQHRLGAYCVVIMLGKSLEQVKQLMVRYSALFLCLFSL